MFKSAARSLQRLSILLPIVLTSPAVLHARPADGNLFTHRFAPEHGLVSPSEEPFRTEICLNGLWRFEPLALPAGYKPGAGPPHLPNPTTNGWSQIPIRIPSPWNVDAFGKGNGYEFDTFPSYPQKWQDVKMGWLKTTFTVPANWKGRQIVLHFMSIVGAARIVVNGHRAADHFNNFLPFDVDVTPWVHIGGPNTLLVGVRKGTLMNIAGPYQSKYTYPTGSFWGMSMVGIDQDVYLLARPRLHIKSVFIQPLVNRNLLRAVVKVANRSGSPQTIALAAGIRPWHWRGKHNDITAPESKYSLGKTVVQMVAARGSVKAGQTKTFTLETKVNHAAALWTLNHPHLYALVAELNVGGAAHDRLSTRFGWRQWTIHGRKLLLNGKPVQLMADAWHFLGVPAMTPRYAWAWFTMLKQAHCNAVRLHAQPRPPFFLQMADQMGIAVLDESGIWASHCHFNYWQPITWKRFARAIKAQVHRDRNHACVFGWSVANEIQAAMYAARVKPADKPMVTAKVVTLAHMVEAMDPTRPWVSSDGDGDMEGRLPVWVAHYGTPRGWQATYKHIHKPFAIGECTETYYSTPPMVAKIEGDRAYQSMRDYMQGLAVQGYDYALAERKFCAYGSLWDLVWYGLKPLPLGLANQSRPATLRDGIFFGPYQSHQSGMQPERLGPYCSTLNPGYDPRLPLYRPWSFWRAVVAARAPSGPQPSRWSRAPAQHPLPMPQPPTIKTIGFIGNANSALHQELTSLGFTLTTPTPTIANPGAFFIVDAAVAAQQAAVIRTAMTAITRHGGTLLVLNMQSRNILSVNKMLPEPVALTNRRAASLVKGWPSNVTAPLSLASLYFAQDKNPWIIAHGLTGPFVAHAQVLLHACPTNWLAWTRKPEFLKPATVYESQRQTKTAGAALVRSDLGKGRLFLATLRLSLNDPRKRSLLRALLVNLRVADHARRNEATRLHAPSDGPRPLK